MNCLFCGSPMEFDPQTGLFYSNLYNNKKIVDFIHNKTCELIVKRGFLGSVSVYVNCINRSLNHFETVLYLNTNDILSRVRDSLKTSIEIHEN